MDPQKFDGIVQRLSGMLSRRSLVGGSLGASVLAMIGLGDRALTKTRKARGEGKKAKAEACIPTGKKCPAKKPRGKKGQKLSCNRCCQDFVTTLPSGKRKCGCRPDGQPCGDSAANCCSATCANGQCAPCPAGTTPCSGQCVDLQTNNQNCGQCGLTCRPGSCTNGQCACPAGTTVCGEQCVDLQTSQQNCGACGNACSPNKVCTGGACQAVCRPVTRTVFDVTPAGPGAFTATTTGTNAAGILIFEGFPAGTTFADVEIISSAYDFELGDCVGGAPRFVVFLDDGSCPVAHFPPTTGCSAPGATGNTGNLIGNNTPTQWTEDCSSAVISTYAEALALFGTIEVDQVALVVDESPGGSERTVTLTPCVALV